VAARRSPARPVFPGPAAAPAARRSGRLKEGGTIATCPARVKPRLGRLAVAGAGRVDLLPRSGAVRIQGTWPRLSPGVALHRGLGQRTADGILGNGVTVARLTLDQLV